MSPEQENLVTDAIIGLESLPLDDSIIQLVRRLPVGKRIELWQRISEGQDCMMILGDYGIKIETLREAG